MSSKWFEEQPKNRNFLAPVGFKMNLDLFAGVDFFCQRVNVPDISVGNIEVPSRFRSLPLVASGGVNYGDLNLQFIVDEDLKNYLTIWKWIRKNSLAEEMDDTPDPQYSNAQLQILNSNYQPNIIVEFENIFPVSLTELSFDVSDTDVEYLTSNVVFKFQTYYFTDKQNKRI